MQSKTIHAKSNTELLSKIQSAITPNFQPTLGIVFNSIQNNIAEIQAVFNQHHIDIVGGTTAGEIIDNQLLAGAIVVLLMDMNRDFYMITSVEHEEKPYKSAFNLGTNIKIKYKNIGVLMVTAGFGTDATSIVNGIKDGIGKEIPMYGGMAGDDLQMEKTYAFSNQTTTSKGSVLLVINTDKITMSGLATSGWQAIGVEKTITKSDGHVIYEINNERAYDVFTRYFGLINRSDSMEYLLSLQTNYPLQIIRDNDTILRSPLVMDQEAGTITLMGGISQGDKFRFSNSPGFEVIDQTIEEFQGLKNKTPEADALILFSCKGRHGALGPLIEDEIEGLYNYWQTPMIGFLSYGEIGNTPNGTCEFHNETCSLVILKEK